MNPYIQQILNKLCQEEPLNGTWVEALARAVAINEGETDIYGNQWQFICENLGVTEPVNGSWQQALAVAFGGEQPTNGTWIQTIYDNTTQQECGSQAYVTNGYVTNGYVSAT